MVRMTEAAGTNPEAGVRFCSGLGLNPLIISCFHGPSQDLPAPW